MALVLSDLDDTFLAHDKRVPDENLAALDLLLDRGVPFVPCTGRALADVPRAITGHGACRHVIACNGALVWDLDLGVALRETFMSAELVRDVYLRVRDLDITFDLFVGGRVYAERARLARMLDRYGLDAGTLAMLREIRTPVDTTVPETLARLGLPAVEKVTAYWADRRARDGLAERLSEFRQLDVTSSHARNFELVAAGVSKGQAMTWLAGRLGAAPADIIAFGDSPNDATMLARAGDGVAVANAADKVLRLADHVCAGCDDAGPGRYLLAHPSLGGQAARP